MRPRITVIELFSTFIQFTGDRFDGWVGDRRLQHSMKERLAQADHALQPERFWTLYWYKLWQDQVHQQATNHLSAYLQEPCYWATQRITQRFPHLQWSLADGFQTAIAHTPNILKRYKPDFGSDLKAYAGTAFSNLIRDQLRQQQEVNICSDWGLLRRLSRVQLQRSLLAAGFAQTEPAILAWECFKAVCTPDPSRSVRAIPPPTPDQFAQMAEHYNQQRTQLSPMPPGLDGDGLVDSLNHVVQAARAYLAPTVTSLNQPKLERPSTEQLDKLSSDDTPMNRLLEAEVYVERQRRAQQIGEVLRGAIAHLAPTDQSLLRFYYREALTQKEIAHQLKIQQYQVSRQLSRIRQQLLLKVAQWSQETLHISINSSVLSSMSNVIHEWLEQYYRAAAEGPDERGI